MILGLLVMTVITLILDTAQGRGMTGQQVSADLEALTIRNRSFQGVLPFLKDTAYPATVIHLPEQNPCPLTAVPLLNGNN